ncbi:hypothetical protein BOTBODRAFT_26937 [Botryobasidium botryosum FD-172 SS1]|uniref:NAD(P)H-hydrate epimerase n=1 Tax=Botryobasidium botryosum (strain FD-172 SS1) TaxID=930990 RepID=A0A067NAZ0_BOTB1|nr:hypothetical protein BOTBODRAFT_26937 [Botryobasidium botryosum FD-172 SS1]
MPPIRYLTAKLAQQIDEELMSAAGAFSLDQLMELAGLACAQTLAKVYGKQTHEKVLVCCGPGNQGGDGLVAARHLSMFGYKPTIYMPKPGKKDIYQRLHTQCKNLSISTIDSISDLRNALNSHHAIMDAIFGFSFEPPVRAPFDEALPLIASSGLPTISVDIPSGWHVENGPIKLTREGGEELKGDAATGISPDVLISLTAPKEGVRVFKGRHFLGGRFISRELEKKFELNLPEYPGYEQIVELSAVSKGGEKL